MVCWKATFLISQGMLMVAKGGDYVFFLPLEYLVDTSQDTRNGRDKISRSLVQF